MTVLWHLWLAAVVGQLSYAIVCLFVKITINELNTKNAIFKLNIATAF
jgi:hypothetical protein